MVPLEDLIEVLDNLRAPINADARSRRLGGVPYYGANGQQGWIDKFLTNEPLILLAEDGGNFDDFENRPIAYRIDGPAWVNNHAHIIRAKPGVSQSFIFWSIAHKDIRQFIAGGTRSKLTQGELRRIKVRTPDEPQRAKISEILDTLDTTICQTEAIIEKLTQVKLGLLHDLLTRGIDAGGGLRPPQSEAPHLYKDSPLGWVPIEWQVQRLANYMAADITYGIVQAGPHIEGGVPYVRTGDMSGDRLSKASMLCTTRRIADAFRRSEVRVGDIVMAIRATVGKVLAVPHELDGANLTQGTARLAPNQQSDAVFLLWAIRHQRAQNSIASEIKGTTFAEITLAALREVLLAAPVRKEEQFEIGKRMTACESRIFQELRYLEKLKVQKSGVMDDLLTGRVRVTRLLEAAI